MALEAQNNPFTSILMVEAADVEALPDDDPAAGQRRLAVGPDHLLYLVDDAGVKTLVGGAGIANPLATDSLWDAAGDLVQGSGANTAAKLSAGTAGKVLTSNGAAAALTWETPAGGGAMATDALWDAAGDLAQGTGANTGAKLSAGTAGYVLTSNGAAAAVGWAAPPGTYTSFTPALTATSVNPTLGSGSSVAGSYTQIGKFVQGCAVILWGSSGTATGTGTYIINLPVNADFPSGATSLMVGEFYTFDGSSTERAGILRCTSATPGLAFLAFPASGANTNVNTTTPHAWSTGDQITYTFYYKGV